MLFIKKCVNKKGLLKEAENTWHPNFSEAKFAPKITLDYNTFYQLSTNTELPLIWDFLISFREFAIHLSVSTHFFELFNLINFSRGIEVLGFSS